MTTVNAEITEIRRDRREELQTPENWEQGRAKPNAQAALLINLVNRDPDTVERLASI